MNFGDSISRREEYAAQSSPFETQSLQERTVSGKAAIAKGFIEARGVRPRKQRIPST